MEIKATLPVQSVREGLGKGSHYHSQYCVLRDDYPPSGRFMSSTGEELLEQ